MVSLLNGTHCERLAPGGRGKALSTWRYRLHVMRVRPPRRPSHLCQHRRTSWRIRASAGALAGDAIVGVMTSQLAAQRRVLVAHLPVPMYPAPLANPPQHSAESVFRRLALHDPSPLPGAPPIVGEPQHREAALSLRAAPLRLRRAAKLHQPRSCPGAAEARTSQAASPAPQAPAARRPRARTPAPHHRHSAPRRARPRSRGFTSCSNHTSSTSCR